MKRLKFAFLALLTFQVSLYAANAWANGGQPDTVRYEAEDHYVTVADVGTRSAVSVSNGFVQDSADSVRAYDVGDTIDIPFSVAETGDYELILSVNTGTGDGSGAVISNDHYVPGYLTLIDGVSHPFRFDSAKMMEPNNWTILGLIKLPSIALTAGNHTIRISSSLGWTLVDYLEVKKKTQPDTVRYEAEDHYVTVADVGTRSAVSVSNGFVQDSADSVRAYDVGDTIDIPFSVAETGDYELILSVNTGTGDGSGAVISNDHYVPGYLTLIDGVSHPFRFDSAKMMETNNWTILGLIKLPSIALTAGNHTIRISSSLGWTLVDYLEVKKIDSNPVSPGTLLACVAASKNCDLSQWYQYNQPSRKNYPSNGANTTVVNNISQLRSALNNSNPGDVVYIASGAVINLTSSQDQKFNNIKGTASAKIKLTTDPNNPGIIDGSAAPYSANGAQSALEFYNTEYLEISNIIVRNMTNWGLYFGEVTRSTTGNRPLLSVSGTCKHIDILNVSVLNTDNAAISIKADSHNFLLDGVKIDGTFRQSTPRFNEGIYIGDGNSDEGYYIDRTHNIVIRNSEISNRTAEAIDVKPGTHSITIENNYIHDIELESQGAITVGWRTNRMDTQPVGNINVNIDSNIIADTVKNPYEAAGIAIGMGNAVIKNNVLLNIAEDNESPQLIHTTNRFESSYNSLSVLNNTCYADGNQVCFDFGHTVSNSDLPNNGVNPEGGTVQGNITK